MKAKWEKMKFGNFKVKLKSMEYGIQPVVTTPQEVINGLNKVALLNY